MNIIASMFLLLKIIGMIILIAIALGALWVVILFFTYVIRDIKNSNKRR